MSVKVYRREDVKKTTRHRPGEIKIGDMVQVALGEWQKDLAVSDALFVILGIPEDIGVKANHGRVGASSAVKPAIDSFLNQQDNFFINASKIFLLGELEVVDLVARANELDAHLPGDLKMLRDIVKIIDGRLIEVIKVIVSLKKIPVIIGGGHNNAYGNIRGCSEATGAAINVINCDPHLDFRPLEGRHSGNGFSYAYDEGFLNKYSVVAMHEQYNSSATLQKFTQDPVRLYFNTYERIFVREELDFSTALSQCISFLGQSPCGIEIDLDAITNVPSSAKTSSGISALQARQYIHKCASLLEPLYLHIAEGAPVLSHIKADNKTGKLISYLISDFMKGYVLSHT